MGEPMYVGVIVELKEGQFSYYFGQEGKGIPNPGPTFSSRIKAEQALQNEFSRFEAIQPNIEELEYIKENEEDDTLALLKNLFE